MEAARGRRAHDAHGIAHARRYRTAASRSAAANRAPRRRSRAEHRLDRRRGRVGVDAIEMHAVAALGLADGGARGIEHAEPPVGQDVDARRAHLGRLPRRGRDRARGSARAPCGTTSPSAERATPMPPAAE